MTTEIGLRLVQDAKEKKLLAERVREMDAIANHVYQWFDHLGLKSVGTLARPLGEKIQGYSTPVVKQVDSGIALVVDTVDKKVIVPVRERKGEVSVRAAFSVANEQINEYAKEKVHDVSGKAREMLVHTVDRVLPVEGEGEIDSLSGPDAAAHDWLTIGSALKTRASTKVSRTISHNLDIARDFSREHLPVDVMSVVDSSADKLVIVKENLGEAWSETVNVTREGLGYILSLDLFEVPSVITGMGLQAVGLSPKDEQYEHVNQTVWKLCNTYLHVFSTDDSKAPKADPDKTSSGS